MNASNIPNESSNLNSNNSLIIENSKFNNHSKIAQIERSSSNILNRFNRRERLSLLSNLRSFRSKKDIEDYYSRVEQEYRINKELLDNTTRQEELFNNTASKEAKQIVEEDLKTAQELSKLKNSKVDPRLVIFIFKSLLEMKKTSVVDIDKESSDYLFLKEHYDNLVDEKIRSYDKDYINVMEGKKYIKQGQC